MKKLLLATAAACAFSASAHADETLKFRAITHLVSVQSADVGDIDGHAMSVVKASGLVSFADGGVGTTTFTTITDYVKGTGDIVRVYQGITYNDGSQLWIKTTGTATVKGANTDLKGAVTILGGTGKFAGVKGEGTMTGERMQTLASGAELYNDVVLTIKK